MKTNKKEFVGTVISDSMDKTRVVLVERTYRHKLYKKVIKVSKKYYAHDAGNSTHLGDKVRIVESRPLSKLKRWAIAEKL